MRLFRAGLVPVAGAAVCLTAAFIGRRRFIDILDALDRRLADAQMVVEARTDLPPEVALLAAQIGADRMNPARYVVLRQSGTMWLKPEATPQLFTAQQRIGTSDPGFVWRAKIGLMGSIWVVDSLVAGRGFLEARMFGTLRVARMDGTAAINQGEGLRYLAELPLNPDAILFDRSLEWSISDPHTINVAMGSGESRAEIAFGLNDSGLICTASAASRAFDETGKRYPWSGRFWDYREICGRHIPHQAEVAWDIDGKAFTYWRGKIESWAVGRELIGARRHETAGLR